MDIKSYILKLLVLPKSATFVVVALFCFASPLISQCPPTLVCPPCLACPPTLACPPCLVCPPCL